MWRKIAICLAALSLLLATSCIGEQCECENGVYQAIYYPVDSTCAPTQFSSIPIEYKYSQIGKWEYEETNYNYRNQTEITYLGCSINLLHKVLVTDQQTEHESMIFSLQGRFDIEEATQLSGRVGRIDYDRNSESEVCRGVYDVVLRKKAELVVQ